MQKDDGKTLSRLTKQVNQTIEISDVLAGRKAIGGTLGKKLDKLQVDETSISKGVKLRNDRFKKFDDYLERMELISNGGQTADKKIKIQRALIQDPKNPDKVL